MKLLAGINQGVTPRILIGGAWRIFHYKKKKKTAGNTRRREGSCMKNDYHLAIKKRIKISRVKVGEGGSTTAESRRGLKGQLSAGSNPDKKFSDPKVGKGGRWRSL